MSLAGKQLVTLSSSAKYFISNILGKNTNPNDKLLLSVKSGGCNGFVYDFNFTNKINKFDEVITIDTLTNINTNINTNIKQNFYIDSHSLLYLAGTKIDVSENNMTSGLVFNNPNKKGGCGCGKSFN